MRNILNSNSSKAIFCLVFLVRSVFSLESPCELPINNTYLNGEEFWYNVDSDIGGFQLDIESSEGEFISVSGGDAAVSGFTISNSSYTILGFSFSGSIIEAGCGVLFNLVVDGILDSVDVIMSNPAGQQFDVNYYVNIEPECDDLDLDGICDDLDDCVGLYDECGICNGGGIPVGSCDCDGNIDSGCGCGQPAPSGCDNQCGSTLVNDECGICGGDNSSCSDCSGTPNGNLELDECGICGGDNSCIEENYYNVTIDETGVSQIIIFEDTITGLQIGDEIGIFDLAGILPGSECSNSQLGEILVGSGIWSGEQLEIIPIGSSQAPCLGGGSVLPGFVSGDSIEIRIYQNGQEIIPEVIYSFGDGLFGQGLPDVVSTINTCQGELDQCGVCNGDNSTCADCAGIPNGAAEEDCFGVCGGSAVVDFCGICDGNNLSCSGCTDLQATNYSSEATFDDGSCEFAPVVVEEVEELEEYDSTVDIVVPPVVFEEVEVDLQIPAGALDVAEGTEVNLEASEVSENELQFIVDNSSSAEAGVEVFEGVSFEATDENGDAIELAEGATLDVELTFEPDRNDYDLGYITADGEIVALGADCLDNGDGTWTCAGDGPGFGSYIVYSVDPELVVEGCTLMAACNYNSEANLNDGSCTFATGLIDCDGNCTVESDCNGECGGDAIVDECNVCGGDNSSCSDCSGTPNGNSELDECGICNGGGPDFECSNGLISCDYAGCCAEVDGVYPTYGPACAWNPTASTSQSFIIFDEITFQGEQISHGQQGGFNGEGECPNNDCDILTAIYNGQSVGWNYCPIVNNSITIAIEHQDPNTPGTENYPAVNQAFAPIITFNFYDASEGRTYYSVASAEVPATFSANLYGDLNIEGDSNYQSCDGFLFGESNCFDQNPGCPLSYDSNFDPSAGLADCSYCSVDYDFCGCTDPSTPTYDPGAILDDGTCEYGFSFTHSLSFGNNLISFPGYLDNSSSQDLLEGLMVDGPNVVFLLGQGVGLFNTATGWSGNLNSILPTSGYWLNVQGSYEWNLEFTSGVESCTSYDISFGNNLLSYKWGSVDAPTLDALGGETFASENFNFILGQGVGLFNTATGWSGNLNNLTEGKGYWVNITNSSLDFRWGFDSCADNIISSNQDIALEKQLPEEFKFIQSTEQAFYLMKDIEIDNMQPSKDDIVLAYNNDILVGSAVWDGEYTAVPVMGKDASGLTDGFCESGDMVEFKLYQHSTDEIIDLSGRVDNWSSLLVTHVEKLSGTTLVELPSELTISPAYPNPFNPVTTVSYSIPADGAVNVSIYDVSGRMIETLTSGFLNAGSYSVEWDAELQPSGMYFLKVQYNNELRTEKIMLVK